MNKITWLWALLVGFFIGIAGHYAVQNYLPKALPDGKYSLVLPHEGAMVVKNSSNGRIDFYRIPTEAVNYIVDSAQSWKVDVTARGLYRLVTVYVPSDEYLPAGSKPAGNSSELRFDE